MLVISVHQRTVSVDYASYFDTLQVFFFTHFFIYVPVCILG